MTKILYKDLSYKLTGLFFEVQNKLGRFCREKQYCDMFEDVLKREGVKYERELEIKKFNNNSPGGNRVDFLIDNKIIIDFKAKKFITKEDYNQMQRYLMGADLELGMIVNFKNSYLKPKRVLNSKQKKFGSFGCNLGHSDRPSGFTLVETLIYVAIIGIIIFAFINFSISISNSNNKSFVIQEVGANSRFVLNKIEQKIKHADSVTFPDTGSSSSILILDMPSGENDTIFKLQDNSLGIVEGVGSFDPLTSNNIKVSNLTFTNLGTDDENRIINISFKIEYNNSSGDNSFNYFQDIRTAVGLRH